MQFGIIALNGNFFFFFEDLCFNRKFSPLTSSYRNRCLFLNKKQMFRSPTHSPSHLGRRWSYGYPTMLYICTKFRENTCNGFNIIKNVKIPILNTTKEHNPTKKEGGVKFLVLCISSDDALYLHKVS